MPETPDTQPAVASGDRVPWPELPSRTGPDPSPGHQAASDDPAVSAILARLNGIPEAGVSAHLDIYTRLHDELRDALNEDVADHSVPAKDNAR